MANRNIKDAKDLTTGESNKKIANVYVNAFRDMLYV